VDLTSTDELLSTTRSVRNRLDLDRPGPRGVIIECLELVLQAPTGGNTQGWRWIVITDEDTRRRMGEFYREGSQILQESASRAKDAQSEKAYRGADYLLSVIERVPVLVIPCIRGSLEGADTLRSTSIFGSILPATWSFMLALRSRGLGSSWTTLRL